MYLRIQIANGVGSRMRYLICDLFLGTKKPRGFAMGVRIGIHCRFTVGNAVR